MIPAQISWPGAEGDLLNRSRRVRSPAVSSKSRGFVWFFTYGVAETPGIGKPSKVSEYGSSHSAGCPEFVLIPSCTL
jgi:hypothetical protein